MRVDGSQRPLNAIIVSKRSSFLSYKWSRSDITEPAVDYFFSSSDENMLRAASVFTKKREEDRLPTPLDNTHTVAQFIGHEYAHHRYCL